MEKGNVRYQVGIGGWEHDVLDQCFYPRANAASAEKLAYYARFFEAVEVRSTFWDDTLTADDAKQWIDAVAGAGTFSFFPKLHADFTHKKTVNTAATRNLRGILQMLESHNRLGAVLMQFPYGFTNTSSHRFHLTRLAEIFGGFPLHAELRHDSWHTPSLMGFLAENGLRPVSADLPRIKQYMPFTSNVAGDTAYIRLHGRNEKGWLLNGSDTRYDYLYNARELQELRRRLEMLSTRCKQVTIICNNTTGGKAVATALQISSMLRDTKLVQVPAHACKSFPCLRGIGAADEQQVSLFGGMDYRAAM